MNILVIAAHPDDEVLGCGGTIARLSREGHDVYVAILGEGITSRYDKHEQIDQGIIKELQNQSRRASKMLGVKELFLYDLPDNRFDTVPLLDIVKIIEGLIFKVQPTVVYTHHGGDLNVDHNVTFQATLTATRPLPEAVVKTVYSYEVPSSTEWAFQSIGSIFKPNTFVDITDTLDQKIRAMRKYHTETRSYPHPRSQEALCIIAQRWGSVVGVTATEAFKLVRGII